MERHEHLAETSAHARRPVGRPRRRVAVVLTSVKIPKPLYDAYAREARARDISIHSLLIEVLKDAQLRPRHAEFR